MSQTSWDAFDCQKTMLLFKLSVWIKHKFLMRNLTLKWANIQHNIEVGMCYHTLVNVYVDLVVFKRIAGTS